MQVDNMSQRAQVNIFNLKFRPLVMEEAAVVKFMQEPWRGGEDNFN